MSFLVVYRLIVSIKFRKRSAVIASNIFYDPFTSLLLLLSLHICVPYFSEAVQFFSFFFSQSHFVISIDLYVSSLTLSLVISNLPLIHSSKI